MSSRFQIAPMVDWTYSAYRVFLRLMLPRAKLFTEMLVPRAILNYPERFLAYDDSEHPLVLQLGGSHPQELLAAARLAESLGYDEINLNLGCPSERVQAGAFGACLMKQNDLVKACLETLHQGLSIPITAKTRIGVDEQDSFDFFHDFIDVLINAGCQEIVVHARKALLKGLNPKQNRTIPPIHYDYVYRIKQMFPKTRFVLNGEVKTRAEVIQHLTKVDGVMLGRLACDKPFVLQEIHQAVFPEIRLRSREEVISLYLDWVQTQAVLKSRLGHYFKPLLNAYHATIYAKAWKTCVQHALKMQSFSSLYEFISNINMDETIL